MSNRKFVSHQDLVDATARLQRILDDRAKPAPSPKPIQRRALATIVLALAMLTVSFVFSPLTNRHGGPAPCDPPGSACQE